MKSRRQQLGITQEELAWRADLHRTYIADIERGGRNITLRSIASLANALQIPIERLLSHVPAAEAPHEEPSLIGEILLVEDNLADAELTLRAFKQAKLMNPLRVLRDGQEAVDYLFGEGRYKKRGAAASPQLVLLDLGLPSLSGLEVLRRIKNDPRTRDIPVVVLTASRHDDNIIECGRLGADNYIIKPVSFGEFCKVTPKFSLRWKLLHPDSTESSPQT